MVDYEYLRGRILYLTKESKALGYALEDEQKAHRRTRRVAFVCIFSLFILLTLATIL